MEKEREFFEANSFCTTQLICQFVSRSLVVVFYLIFSSIFVHLPLGVAHAHKRHPFAKALATGLRLSLEICHLYINFLVRRSPCLLLVCPLAPLAILAPSS